MLLCVLPYSMTNSTYLLRKNFSGNAIDSGVLMLRMTDDLVSGTLSEVYNGQEVPLVSCNHGTVDWLTKAPFVWRRRSDFKMVTNSDFMLIILKYRTWSPFLIGFDERSGRASGVYADIMGTLATRLNFT